MTADARGSQPASWIVQWAGLVPAGATVLDVAAGGGRHTRFFADRGHKVTAVDRDTTALQAASNIEVIHVRGNVYMFASDFGNATVQVGEHRDNDGAFMVDTGSTETAPKILAELQKLTKKPLRYVVNTSANVEHLAGNDVIAKPGEVRDIAAIISWIARQPDLDRQRIAVTGGSYGGYMSLACMVMFADILRCGIDVVGISNFVTFLNNTQDYRRDLRRVTRDVEPGHARHTGCGRQQRHPIGLGADTQRRHQANARHHDSPIAHDAPIAVQPREVPLTSSCCGTRCTRPLPSPA